MWNLPLCIRGQTSMVHIQFLTLTSWPVKLKYIALLVISTVSSNVMFYLPRFCSILFSLIGHKGNWCFPYAERAPKTYKKHLASTVKKDACCLEPGVPLRFRRLWTYRVIRMVEVWHFPSKSSDLFTGYIDTFLKIKQEASGWPSWCQTEERKRQYIRKYERNEGIKLDPAKIKKNPGLRSLAKLMLNSFRK